MKALTTLLLLFMALTVFSQDVEMYIEEETVYMWDTELNSPKKIGEVAKIKGEYVFDIEGSVFYVKLTKKEWSDHIYIRTGATTREKVGKLYVKNKKEYPDIWTIKLDKDLKWHLMDKHPSALSPSSTSTVSSTSVDPFHSFVKRQFRKASR